MPTLASLLRVETVSEILTRGLAIAEALGLAPSTWAASDPTRSLYRFAATVLASLESMAAGFVGSGFLDYAEGDWLTILADQIYNVQRVEATYATPSITLANTGGGLYVLEAGDVVVRNAAGKTYTNTNTEPVTLNPGAIIIVDFQADEAGSASSSLGSTITTLVTTLLGVAVNNTTACVGLDEESDASLRDRCRAKLGTLSAGGPRDAYDFIVRDSSKTGTTEITRSRTIADSTDGTVTTYVAGPSGSVDAGAVTAAQAAVERWATPGAFTATVANTSDVLVPVTYEIWAYDSVDEDAATIEAEIGDAVSAMFAARPIGGDIIAPARTGALYQSLIASTIRGVYPEHTFRVSVSAPAGDTALAIDEVAALGLLTATIHLETAP